MKDVAFNDFIEQVRLASDIVQVISEYVPLKKKGRNFWGCCPFHHEKTPSFSVTPDKGFFYCFGCQAGGNVFNFLMKVENINFWEAAKLLAYKLNIPMPEKEKTAEERQKEKELAQLYRANELASDFFHACLTKTQYGKAARQYLAARGVNDKMIAAFKLGFAPPAWDKLSNALAGRGMSEDTLLKAGLIVPRQSGNGTYDRFRNRIMFPIFDVRGAVLGFGGRVLDDSQPKYLNSPETVLFNKRHILYGLHAAYKAMRDAGQAIVVEGYMDAITAHAAGQANVVASLGTAFTVQQAKELLKHASEVIFAYDSDTAGQNATIRALGTIRGLGANVRVISIPEGKDPDEYIRKRGITAFQELIKQSLGLLDYQLQHSLANADYTTLEGKVAVVEQVVPVLATFDNAVEVSAHVAHLAQVLGIDESSIRSEVRKYLRTAEKDKTVNSGKTINMRISRQPVNAIVAAEQQLIRLVFDDPSILPYVQSQLTVEDFHDFRRKEIMNTILDVYNRGKPIDPAPLSLLLKAESNAELSQIMALHLECEDRTKAVDDFVKAIQVAHLQALYEQHRLKADELERMGDSAFLQELAESKRIKDEIGKLYQS